MTHQNLVSKSNIKGMEYAAFVPEHEIFINETPVSKSRIAIFEGEGGEITFENFPH